MSVSRTVTEDNRDTQPLIGCHIYVRHYTHNFTNSVTDLKTGWLGSVLSQSGRAQLKEAQYYYVPNPKTGAYATKPRGYNSVFIKAVAVSCAGCNNVQKYATFTCHMPLANG